MAGVASRHIDRASHVQRNLYGDVRGGAKAEQADSGSLANVGALQGAVADDPGAKQRRGRDRLEGIGYRIREIFVNRRELGISAIFVVAGESGAGAKIFVARFAVSTLA